MGIRGFSRGFGQKTLISSTEQLSVDGINLHLLVAVVVPAIIKLGLFLRAWSLGLDVDDGDLFIHQYPTGAHAQAIL